MGVSGGWMSRTGLTQEIDPPDETHIACACRPEIAFCGRYSPNADVETTTIEQELAWCAGCLTIFEGLGCGICGCRSGWPCPLCQAA